VLLTILLNIGDIQYTKGSCQAFSRFVFVAGLASNSFSYIAYDENLWIEDTKIDGHGWVDPIL
jgi:hypothetical protein